MTPQGRACQSFIRQANVDRLQLKCMLALYLVALDATQHGVK